MISKTYVNEIDVSKVKAGQKVSVMVDAFPERKYTGIVTSVANIGEQLPNADAKVFEVQVKLDGSDPILRPSMTTGNKIVTKTIDNVIYVPLECVQSGTDSVPFVYTKNKTKQVVLLGESNENNVIIEKGLEPKSVIYLNTPEGGDKYKIAGADLIPVIKEKEKARKAEEMRIRKEAEEAAKRRAAENPFGGAMMMQGGGASFQMQGGANFQRQGGSGTTQIQGGTGNFQNQGAGGNTRTQSGGANFQRPSGPRDTAAIRRMMKMMQQQGGDTAAMRRRFMQYQNGGGQRGGMRDSSARRRNSQSGQQSGQQNFEIQN